MIMKLATVAVLFAIGIFTFVECLELAQECDPEACKLPTCRCSSTDIPGGLEARNTPQFVILTFDDAINSLNLETYRSVVYNRRNKLNNCHIGTTFFVSHEYTEYNGVNELYNRGFEIALHSITHKTDQAYWRDATAEALMKEFSDQRRQMAHFAGIPINNINGVRSPFLQMAGNATFEMMAQANFRYDLSWPTIAYTDPGLWPYTLHYQTIQDCIIQPCPNAAIPGPWVLPIVAWQDLEGFPCSFVDTCFYRPNADDEDGWFKFMVTNFERHYNNNRAPFGFYVHEWFISSNPVIRSAFVRFLDMLNNLNDVFMVNANDVIDWVQNPISIDEYAKQPCKVNRPAPCRFTTCGPLQSEHNAAPYYLRSCNRCPRNYPWIDNPLGV